MARWLARDVGWCCRSYQLELENLRDVGLVDVVGPVDQRHWEVRRISDGDGIRTRPARSARRKQRGEHSAGEFTAAPG